jgi:hypothetical protein
VTTYPSKKETNGFQTGEEEVKNIDTILNTENPKEYIQAHTQQY